MTKIQELIRDIRAMADALEQTCHGPDYENFGISIFASFYAADKEQFLRMVDAHPGGKKSSYCGKLYYEIFIGSTGICFNIAHEQICERKVVTKTLPATEAVPAQPERTVEEVVWECPDSLLRMRDEMRARP